MAQIRITVENDRIIFQETEDRNGPALSIALANKQSIRQAINGLTNHGDTIVADGDFVRREDTTHIVEAIFTHEADCDAWIALKGAGYSKTREVVLDDLNWKAVKSV